ncbi:MAG: ribonuclease Y [Chloroflexi bacterium]|nr:ribonuclease Y [Chloroflexota bacterium]
MTRRQAVFDTMLILLLLWIVTVAAAAGAGYVVKQARTQDRARKASEEAERLLREAHNRHRDLLLEAKDEALKLRTVVEAELRERRAELQRQERRLQQKEETLDRRQEGMERRERAVTQTEKELDAQRADVGKLRQQQMQELERIAGLTQAEAREVVLKAAEDDVRQEAGRRARAIIQEAREDAERQAREIVTIALQRYAADQVSETTAAVVALPNEEMKGRIIGREGRNIRALEAATGVDLIIDDTPDAVMLSGFDPVRREIARVALTKLIADGRIHPARIEEMVQKARQEVEQVIREAADQAAYDAGVHGLHPELLKVLGRLKFRTSYGQNVLGHSVECAHLASVLAAELGADIHACRASALLHDVGKALSHEVEGPHAFIGADVARRYGLSAKIVNAIANHHAEMDEPQSIEAIIAQVADAISGARPGARRETMQNYVKRLEALETVANSFPGVEKSFAIQAGREVRIIVKPDEVDDYAAVCLARDIVKKIEETLEYPGQIRVTVVRETRAVEYAK